MSKKSGTSGFTLIELLVGLAAASVVFLAAGVVFFRGVDLSSFFFRNAATMEQISDGITQLSALMPQVVRIRACNCSGAGASSEATCTWQDSAEWADPVFDHSVPTDSILFDADYEHGFGGTGFGAAQYLASDQTLTSFYTALFPANYCHSDHAGNVPAGVTSRGCRRRMRLFYTAATTTPATTSLPGTGKPGQLKIQLNDVGWAGTPTELNIGTIDSTIAGRVGVVQMSCGFATPAAGQVGTDFVINIRTKIKANAVEDPASDFYEAWRSDSPVGGGTKFSQGLFREAKLRFSFLNLSQRGAYQWRLLSVKNCKVNGDPARSREECCSMAKDPGTPGDCKACVRSGQPATDNDECCSEKISGGNCA